MASRPDHEPPLASRRAAWDTLWRVLLAPPREPERVERVTEHGPDSGAASDPKGGGAR
jgi:hypothetical protein